MVGYSKTNNNAIIRGLVQYYLNILQAQALLSREITSSN